MINFALCRTMICTSGGGGSSIFAKMLLNQFLGRPTKRCLHTSHSHGKLPASAEIFRQARFMKKLMTGSNRSRQKFFTVEQPVSKTFIEMGSSVRGGPSAGTASVKSKKCLRRVDVLNTVFMEQITSMMSTGEVSPEILGLGLTVSSVKISNDFTRVNVYWVATGTTKDDIIEPLLRRAAGKLRHELTQLRVIGIVPPIEFVKDTTHSRIAEVEYLLAKCDFGEDFVPTTPSNLFVQNQIPTNANDLNLINKSSGDESPVEESEGPVPSHVLSVPTTEAGHYASISMRQDVLGVRHDVIMTHIREMMNRVRSKKQGVLNVPERDTVEDDRVEIDNDCKISGQSPLCQASLKTTREEVADAKKRQQEFFKYLKKQQLSKAVQLKQLTTDAKDREFYEQEAEDRAKKHIFDFVDVEGFDDDFDEAENEDDLLETYYSKSDSAQYR